MKKFYLFLVSFLFVVTLTNAQQVNLGLNAGLVTGDFKGATDYSLTLEASYLYEISDKFHLGAIAGISNYFTAIDGGSDEQYVPLALALRVPIAERFSLGVDLGYAFTLDDAGEDGFYYSPRLSLKLNKALALTAAYKVIQINVQPLDIDFELNSFNVGLEFKL